MKTKILLFTIVLAGMLHFGANAQWAISGANIYNTNSGNVGIGTTTPTKKLEIVGPGFSSTQNLILRNNSTNSFGMYAFSSSIYDHSVVSLCRARGTYASPSGVLAGDRIGSLGGGPYIDNGYRGSVGIDFYVGSSPGVNSYPAYMIFGTTPTSGISRLERMRITESGNVGIGITNPSYLLQVNGVMAAAGYQTVSDLRFKQNIKKMTGSLDKISQIEGYSYSFNLDKFKDKNFPNGEQMGVLAQEIQKIFPHSVMQDAEGYLSVNYISLIPVMIQAIKELKSQLDQTRANQLASTLLASDVQDVEMYRGAYLNQNAPNPFNSKTSIEYIVPDNAYTANIIVHDLSGKQIKRIEITDKGTGSIDIASENLTPGFYLYSLVLDGKPILTKKMILGN